MNQSKTRQNPFPGLRPFREDEEHLFFGRENQVDAMVDKLAVTRFLAVVGTSGSGKSSLVNSGLCPALRGGLMTNAGTAWRIARFRPGSDPVGAMANALSEEGLLFREFQSEDLTLYEIVETTLRMSSLGSIDLFKQSKLKNDVNLLIVVDQFEELFRYQQKGSDQQGASQSVTEDAVAFVNLLLEAKNQTKFPIYVILTMRSDFLGDCAQFAGLPEAINEGQFLVPRMTRDERRAAISGPVGVGGAQISPVLLTRLVNDVGDNPDQLSILQHALNRTWSQWQHEGGGEGPLDLPHYEAIGTMANALDQHAEKAYAELGTERQQQVCEKLFKALTDKATDQRGIRRPTKFGTLCSLANATPDEITQVIEVFRKPSRSFLMPPAGESLEAETVIDISHESLLRVWKRLDAWADEEADSARIYERLTETSVLHADGQASLWQDPELQLALDWREENQPNEVWAEQYHPGFATAMKFLDASLDERNKKIRNQRLRTIASVAGIMAIVLLVVIGYIVIDKNTRATARLKTDNDAKLKQTELDNQRKTSKLTQATADHTRGLLEKEKGNNVEALNLFCQARDAQKPFYDDDELDHEIALSYSNTIMAIGSIKDGTVPGLEDLSTADESYNLALDIRRKLSDSTDKKHPKWVEYNLRFADVLMSIAILEEKRIDFGKAHEKQDLKQFNLAKGYYDEAQEIRKNVIESGLGDDSAKVEAERDSGKCFQNLQGLHYDRYLATLKKYFATEDKKEKEDLKKLLTIDRDKVIDYGDNAKTAVKALAEEKDAGALHTSAKCNVTLALIKPSEYLDLIEQAYRDLVKIVRANPGVADYRRELEWAIDEWRSQAESNGDSEALLKPYKREIANFFDQSGDAAEDPRTKLKYFEDEKAVLEEIPDDSVAKGLLAEVIKKIKENKGADGDQ